MTLAIFALISAPSVTAQDLDHAAIVGRVVDSSGLPIPGVSITASMAETGVGLTAATDMDGRFRFVTLQPGSYSLTAAAPGFASYKRTGVELISAQQVALAIALSPAGVLENVVVDDDVLAELDVTRTVVGSTILADEIEELPNLDRNALDLIQTVGGVSEEALSTSDLAEDRDTDPRSTPFEQGNFSLSGGASYSNNVTIDGMDNNDDRSARDRFQPSLEAVQEVQVVRNQFSAEYGRASGGRVNLRTRAGTSRYRGRAFMFYRDSLFNANSWYNNSRNKERPPLRNFVPGLTLGGPLNVPFYQGAQRTFFFFAFEHQLLEDTTEIYTYLPTAANPNFSLPAPNGAGEFCDQAGGGPPPCVAGAGMIAPYSAVVDTPNSGNIFSGRIDHRFTKKNVATIGFQLGRRRNRRTTAATTTRLEEALQIRNIDTEAVNFTSNHVLSARAVNQFRVQWSSYRPSYQTEAPGEPVVLIGYRNPETNATQTLIAGNSSASTLQNFANSRNETRWQLQDSMSYVVGLQALKFGFDVQHVDSRANALSDGTGTFNFSNVHNYSTNNVTRFRQNFGTSTDVRNSYWGVFMNDEVRVRPNLAVNFGVRYERETAVSDANNFAPRLGVAWDPARRGKDVIRLGAGVFYNRVLLRTVGDYIQNRNAGLEQFDSNSIPTTTGTGTLNPRNQILAAISQRFPSGFSSAVALRSFIAGLSCGPVNAPVPCSSSYGFAANTGSAVNPLRSVDPNIRIPESYQFNIGYERKLPRGFVFEANYTINKTAHLWREYNTNLPVLPTGYSDLTEYLLDNPFTFTNFNGTVRTYNFYLGNGTSPSGVTTLPNGTSACTPFLQNGGVCWVDLNTISTSTAVPNTNASDGVSVNATGGPIGIAREALRHLRPDPSVDEKERVASIGNAFYQGLVLELRRRYRRIGAGFGVSMRAAYTLSRTMDDGLNNTSNAEVNDDFAREWARARQDRLHRFAFSGMIDTPSWLGKLRFSPIFRYGSAGRFNLGYGVDRNLNDQSTDR
ncbi:MAG: TonB-dependent receptor, partial [Blastocatellia bacterium]|nr:TonB-dependent receptor [Blastocatellia bacterium]